MAFNQQMLLRVVGLHCAHWSQHFDAPVLQQGFDWAHQRQEFDGGKAGILGCLMGSGWVIGEPGFEDLQASLMKLLLQELTLLIELALQPLALPDRF